MATATVFATAGFAAVSGASTATAAVFARIAIPENAAIRLQQTPCSQVWLQLAVRSLSLIPPSAILVIYGVIVEQSIGRLLLAGLIPGVPLGDHLCAGDHRLGDAQPPSSPEKVPSVDWR